ncbi:MAG: hypothetical protein Q7K57_28645 [Burkholderiaceae bacterium]|nr:hypothetical protein [Burkholderiaceae bacterium]
MNSYRSEEIAKVKNKMLDAIDPAPPSNGYILRGPIFLASSRIRCWRCKQETGVVAVIATRVDEYEQGKGVPGSDAEYVYGMDEDEMPGALRAALQAVAPNFKPIYSGTMQETTWANVCEHCEALQGTFFQHMEPDGPFFGEASDFAGEQTVLMQGCVAVDFDVAD